VSESQDDKAFHSWLVYGVTKGWISLPVCATHNPLPTMPEEDVELLLVDEGEREDIIFVHDPCMFAIRVWKQWEDEEWEEEDDDE
jgi:hypothetical protein